MKRVFENGRCNDKELIKHLCKWGRSYEVKEEVEKEGKLFYVLAGMQDGLIFDADWFKVVPVILAKSHKIPKIGDTTSQFFTSVKLDWVACSDDEKILCVTHCGGNVYEAYTKFKTYMVDVL